MPGDFAKMVRQNFDGPDDTLRPWERGRTDVVTVGGLTFYRQVVEPGWRWSQHAGPVVGTRICHQPHVRIHLSGRLRIRMQDGSEMEFGPGDVAVVPPGHDGWVVGDEPAVWIELTEAVGYWG
jgi:quercetin dioxygenase-like cupin family protein